MSCVFVSDAAGPTTPTVCVVCRFGFGSMDTGALVDLAKTFTLAGPAKEWKSEMKTLNAAFGHTEYSTS